MIAGKLAAARGRLVERVDVWRAPAAAEVAGACALRPRDAADDVAAAPRERAWQAAWLAERLGLAPA